MIQRRPNAAWVVDDIAYIDVSTPTFPRTITLVDAAGLAAVLDGRGRWRTCRPSNSKTLYVWRWAGTRRADQYEFLHRFILGLRKGDGKMADHANHDGLDNRRTNLRLATPTQNNAHLRSGTGRTRGVRYRANRWHAHIRVSGVQRYLGSFATEEQAARAYDAAARATHGEFAITNYVEATA